MKNYKTFLRSSINVLFSTLMMVLLSFQLSQAKSVYVIGNLNSYGNTPILAYNINPDGSISYQATYNAPYYSGGAVGMTIDEDSGDGYLFIVYEFSTMIQVVDAKTMTGVCTATIPGSGFNAAGVAYDHSTQMLYIMERYTNTLFEYAWDGVNKTLTLSRTIVLNLTSTLGGFGIALDEVNDLLYVAARSTTVDYFDVNALSTVSTTPAGTLTVGNNAIGIAVDPIRQYVFTGDAWSYGGQLCRHDLVTSTNLMVESGNPGSDGTMGVAIDQSTGYVYITTGYYSDRVEVFQSTPGTLTRVQFTGDIGNPTAIVVPGKSVGFNPYNLTKTGLNCVDPSDQITYDLCYDNLGPGSSTTVHNLSLVDALPSEVTFVSASDGGTHASGVVTWDLGTLVPDQVNTCVTLTVDVSSSPGVSFVNSATMDSDEWPPTTVTEETFVKPTLAFAVTPATCPGDSDGEIDLTVTGGAAPVSCLWSSSATTQDITDLIAGMYIVTVTDNKQCTVTGSAQVADADDTPPELNVTTDAIVIWPPNHKYQTFGLSDFVLSVSDNCADLTMEDVEIIYVTSDEEEDAAGIGDGQTLDDIVISDDCKTVALRKERCGGVNGRVYTIYFRLGDGYGNYTTTSAKVHVPHDQDYPVVDDGAVYTVTSSCGGSAAPRGMIEAVARIKEGDLNCYPNPFNDNLKVEYTISYSGQIEIDVVNVLGKRVVQLANGMHEPGRYSVDWDSDESLSGGVYYIRLNQQDGMLMKPIVKQ